MNSPEPPNGVPSQPSPVAPGPGCPVCGQRMSAASVPARGVLQCVGCGTAFRSPFPRAERNCPSPRPPAGNPSAARTPLPDFPGYEIREEVGRGAMGIVFRALHVATGLPVAIKQLLPPRASQARWIARFEREVTLLQRQSLKPHPNVVRFLGFRSDPSTGSYLTVLEFIDGPSLAEGLRGDRLDPPAALAMLEQVARGLDSLHQAGLLHRDLKPRNILLAASGVWKITDFGLVHELADSDPLERPVPAEALAGTPDYIAPELVQGSGEPSVRSDLFSLGAVLCEALTGVPPRGVPDQLDRLVPGLPDGLADLAAWLLHPTPEGRCPDTRRLLMAIDELRRGERPVCVPGSHSSLSPPGLQARPARLQFRASAGVPAASAHTPEAVSPSSKWPRVLAALAVLAGLALGLLL